MKRGTFLVENLVFIILNLIFLTILVLFIINQGSGVIVLEQAYAKEIALIIDSAKPVMEIQLDMEKAKEIAEENGINFEEKGKIVNIEKNIVTVKLSENSGYSYAFFNDVEIDAYPSENFYVFTINEKIEGGENEEVE